MKRNSLSKENLVQQTNDPINGHEAQKSVPETQNPLKMPIIAAQTKLSSSAKRLLRQILDEPYELFYFSPRELEGSNGVNPDPISRTIQTFSYHDATDSTRTLRFCHSDKQDRFCPITKDNQNVELNFNPRFAFTS